MPAGLGVSVVTEVAGAQALASDINTSTGNLQGASAPTFNSVTQTAGVAFAGYFGGSFSNVSSSVGIGVAIPFGGDTMANVPTSLSFTTIASADIGSGLQMQDFRVTGGNLFWTPGSTGQSNAHGTYTTNGNCIIEHHPGPDTFHHHCEVCGRYNLHIPIKALRVNTDKGDMPGASSFAFDCPQCNAELTDDEKARLLHPGPNGPIKITEVFNTGHYSTEEDPAFAKDHPGRHLQVKIHRAIMQTLGLRTHP